MKKSRYPGPRPFTINDQTIFFGRDRDIKTLFQLISQESIVVLYSKSGLGKSSLLNAGIIPRLVDQKEPFIPIPVRFFAFQKDFAEKQPTPLESTKKALLSKAGTTSFIRGLFPSEESLWYHMKALHSKTPNAKGCILIFDQFEELFTYDANAIKDFQQELSEAIYTSIPQRILDKIKPQIDGRKQLVSKSDMEFIHRRFEVKVAIAIRSDRIHLINTLKSTIPDIQNCWYELGSLSIDQAEEAIVEPALLDIDEYESKEPFEYDDEAIERMINYLSKERKQPIESFQLQILCQSIEQKVIKDKLETIESFHVDNVDQLYEDFYNDQLSKLNNPDDQLASRKLIEQGLIFEEEGRRLSLYQGQIEQSFKVSKKLLEQLVDFRLLRAEPNMKGGYTYELCHDTMVDPILRSKHRRLTEHKRQLAEVEWNILIRAIKNNRCTFILGPDFFRDKNGQNIKEILLKNLKEDREHIPYFFLESDGLFFFEKNEHLYSLLLSYALKKTSLELEPSTEQRLLAQLNPNLVLSFSPDSLQQTALKELEKDFQFNFFHKNMVGRDIELNEYKTIYYQVFGTVQSSDSLVLTENDLFKFLSNLFYRGSLEKKLMQLLKETEITLLMGFDWQMWYWRPILQVLLKSNALKKLVIGKSNNSKHENEIDLQRSLNFEFIDISIKDFLENFLDRRSKSEEDKESQKEAVIIENWEKSLEDFLQGTIRLEDLSEIFKKSKNQDAIEKFLVLKARKARLENSVNIGTISNEEARVEENRITNSVLALFDSLFRDKL